MCQVCFYQHLALDFNFSARQHYALRDISRPAGNQVIWSSRDIQYTFKLVWTSCYFSMSGLTVNFYSGAHHTDRIFVSIPLRDLLDPSQNFTSSVRELIQGISALEGPPLSHIGVPSKGYFDGANPTSYLVLGRLLNSWLDPSGRNDVQVINLRKVQSKLL